MPKTTSTTANPGLSTLYGTFGPLIYARCRRALGDERRAAEATQQVFLSLHRQLQRAEPRAAVEAIATTCALVCSGMSAQHSGPPLAWRGAATT